jgi:hypothetical protein
MSRKKIKKPAEGNTDDHITPNCQENKPEEPVVYKIRIKNRRDALKKIAEGAVGIAGIASLSKLLSGCKDTMTFDVEEGTETCSCHVVCTCDKVKDTESDVYDASYYSGRCTCNTVCTCNSVCTCDSEGGGGGGGYYISYWYPN